MLHAHFRKYCAVNLFTAFCLALVLNFALISAGMSQGTALPEKVGVVYLVEGDEFTEIPRIMGKKKTALLITANTKLRMQFAGKSSDFIVDRASSPTFAVVLPSGDTSELSLCPLSVKKKKRNAVIGTGGGFYGESSTGAETRSLDFTKQGDDLFHITPVASLDPGEYAFGFEGSNEYFCFSVR